MGKAPIGIRYIGYLFDYKYYGTNRKFYKTLVLILTFIAYAALHAGRKVLPVVKNQLKGNTSDINNYGFEPFNSDEGSYYFSLLDISWAFSYSIGMLLMGYLIENLGRKLFLSISLFGTGVFLILFGMGYYLDIHSLHYYLTIQIFNGIIQSAGWPSIIPIVSGWVSRETMGTVLGIWGNHYAVGNILGQAISSIFVQSQWGMSFISNGIICIIVSFMIILFLASKPKVVQLDEFDKADEVFSEIKKEDEEFNSLQDHPIKFIDALFIPGVLEYSFSLFFIKVIVYTFLFWLPYYISFTGIKGYDLTPATTALLASLFDFGGIIGNIFTGLLFDIYKKGGLICFALQIFSSLFIFLFSVFGNLSFFFCISLLTITGAFVNAPNTIITGTISANLGQHPNLKGNRRATSTITAIVDGIGCLGAAVAPVIVSQISIYGWNYVMYSLIASCLLSAILLTRVIITEAFYS